MKIANYNGRAALIKDGKAIDLHNATDGRLPSDPCQIFDHWDEIRSAAPELENLPGEEIDPELLGTPSPEPKQVFAIGLNYAPHAAESGFAVPSNPFVFSKLRSSIAGPNGDLTLFSETVDWEVELVAVIGKKAWKVDKADAWDYVAGVTVGQDFSDREVQNRVGPNSQPTLGKSRPGFGPTGPWLVTTDEFADRNNIPLSCSINGEVVQNGTTAGLIFGVEELISYLSDVTELHPGDLIFTGTPAGVGIGQNPPRYLKEGDVVDTFIEGIGTMRHVAVAP